MVTNQLRLVEAPDTGRRPSKATRRQAVRTGRRAAHWADWQLDSRARTVGRQGVAQARAALEQATRERLSKAS
jgi:hypothetical protein